MRFESQNKEENSRADPRGDDNLLPCRILELLLEENSQLKVKTITKKIKFMLAVQKAENDRDASVTCSRSVIADI
eukprot:IDg17936t1